MTVPTPNIAKPSNGPIWLPEYTRSVEREIKRALDNAVTSRAAAWFLYG